MKNICLTQKQHDTLMLIGNRSVLYFDDTNDAGIQQNNTKKPTIPIDIGVFNSLEFLGLLFFKRKIAPGVSMYRINRNTLARVKEDVIIQT